MTTQIYLVITCEVYLLDTNYLMLLIEKHVKEKLAAKRGYINMTSKLLSLLFLIVSTQSLCQTLTWSDLLPKLPALDDPFLALTQDQLYLVSMVSRYNEINDLTETQRASRKNITEQLGREGIDVYALLSVREHVKTKRMERLLTPNKDILGKASKLPGFIIPIRLNGVLVTEFFLVPTAGACIHTPPPPPNQIVLVSYPEGIELPSLYEAFWIQGTLVSETEESSVSFSDGYSNIQSIYKLTAKNIEKI